MRARRTWGGGTRGRGARAGGTPADDTWEDHRAGPGDGASTAGFAVSLLGVTGVVVALVVAAGPFAPADPAPDDCHPPERPAAAERTLFGLVCPSAGTPAP